MDNGIHFFTLIINNEALKIHVLINFYCFLLLYNLFLISIAEKVDYLISTQNEKMKVFTN